MGIGFILGSEGAGEGKSWFGVNADDPPGPARALCLFGRRPAGELSIHGCPSAFADRGFAFLLGKAAVDFGGSVGINERGLTIGTAAAYSVFKPEKSGIGQKDIVRAALCGAETAAEALELIHAAIEGCGQSGIKVAKSPYPADAIFLLSDPKEAYILETAGRRWAWRRADSRDAIADSYSIEEDYKRLDTQTRKEIAPVNERAACSDEADPGRKGQKESWRVRVEKRSRFFDLRGTERKDALLEALGKLKGSAEAGAVLDALRGHRSRESEGVCRHGGFEGAATSFSLAVEHRPGGGGTVVWFTGGPSPCRAVYKPIVCRDGRFVPLWSGVDYSEEPARAFEYWASCERATRKAARDAGIGSAPSMAAVADAQKEIIAAAEAYLAGGQLAEATAAVDAAVARADAALSGA